MDNINQLSRQKGASMWGLIGGAGLFVLFALISMKLIPGYIDNNKVANALEKMAEQPGVNAWTRNQIIQKISDTLYIDMADDLLDLHEAISITKTKTHRVISVDYDRVIPLAYNISALLDFENSVEVPLQ
jgi:hypothetical protein